VLNELADQTLSKEMARYCSDAGYHCKTVCEDAIVYEQEIHQEGAERGETHALNSLTKDSLLALER
jgi:hypothetical protein